MFKKLKFMVLIATAIAITTGVFAFGSKEPVDYVDPFIGTGGHGHTFPGACVPFGMTKWTPQTRAGEKKGSVPYDYMDSKIQGFRGTHFWSGSEVPDYGSVTIMPLTGSLWVCPSFYQRR